MSDGADRTGGPLLSPGFWLHHAALAWRAALETHLRPLGLTPTQFLVLASASWLEARDGPATQTRVGEQAGADRTMTSKVVRVLEEHGLLTRVAHEDDGRAVRIAITARGRTVVDQATAAARAVDERFFGASPGPMRDALRAVADRGDGHASGAIARPA